MITQNRVLANLVVAVFAIYPQVIAAQSSSGAASNSLIAERQIATMGQSPEARARTICKGLEGSALCQNLLGSTRYRDTWLETADTLTRAEWLIAERLVELRGQIDRSNQTVQYMIERAPKLPDGRAVFRAKDGRFFDLNGQQISGELAATAR
ncbi:MAG: hypothetical protein AAF754_18230 [Pseudomonadota bacterium]